MEIVQYSFPTEIHFGPGAVERILIVLKTYRLSRILLVTDKGLRSLMPIQRVEQLLRSQRISYEIFSEIIGNPVKSQVDAGVRAFREVKAECILAVGGGAPMDVAKGIAVMAHHPGDLFDYEDGKPGADRINRTIPPLFAIPTTAGTGSEVGRSTVISDDKTKKKKIIFSPRLLSRVVLADPELLLELPPKMTAATGMDALTHLVESYIAKGFHPICDGIALEGLRLLSGNFEKCYDFAQKEKDKSEEHIVARGAMLNAAMMGAIAFQKGLGVTHSCAHALSTVCDFHHGLANGIIIPYAMKFNLSVVKDRFKVMAQIVGKGDKNPEDFIEWLIQIKERVNIPKTLSEASVKKESLSDLVEVATSDPVHQLNPRPCRKEDIETIFSEAFG